MDVTSQAPRYLSLSRCILPRWDPHHGGSKQAMSISRKITIQHVCTVLHFRYSTFVWQRDIYTYIYIYIYLIWVNMPLLFVSFFWRLLVRAPHLWKLGLRIRRPVLPLQVRVMPPTAPSIIDYSDSYVQAFFSLGFLVRWPFSFWLGWISWWQGNGAMAP